MKEINQPLGYAKYCWNASVGVVNKGRVSNESTYFYSILEHSSLIVEGE